MPNREAVLACHREKPLRWDVLETFCKAGIQGNKSYREQRFAVLQGKLAIDKYMIQVGQRAKTCTKNVIVHGVPGSGTAYIVQLLSLYAMTLGLRVMTTLIMGV